jgi:hypothetical protein
VRRLILPLVVIASLVLGACAAGSPSPSGNGVPSQAPSVAASAAEQGTAEDLEAAARTSFEAFLGADDEAYFNLLSRACREDAGFAAVENVLTQRRRVARGAGIDLAAMSVSRVELSDFTGSTAQVALVIEGSAEPFRESLAHAWVYEDGGWRWSDCSDYRTGGGSGPDTSSRDNPIDFSVPAEINGWFVVVSYVMLDATELVVGEGFDSPGPGQQYVDIQVLLNYDGADPTTTAGRDLALSLVSARAAYEEKDSCGAVVWALDLSEQVGPGGSLRGSICRAVPSDEVGSLLLLVVDLATETEWWFALE